MQENFEFSPNQYYQQKIEKLKRKNEYQDLKFISEINDLRDVSKLAEWFKKEIEEIFEHTIEEPQQVVERLACFLAELQQENINDIREVAKGYIYSTNERTEYWTIDGTVLSDEAFKKFIQTRGGARHALDYEYDVGDIYWMKEHIFEFYYGHGDNDTSAPGVSSFKDTELQNAIEKWLDVIKNLN